MDIVVIGSASTKNERQGKKSHELFLEKKPAVDRRQNQDDRRQEVRDGVTVTFSSRVERRQRYDRRRVPTEK